MANLQITEILKDLPVKILTNSSNKRRKLFDDLCSICNYDLSEVVIKGICKVLPLTLTRYSDSKSCSVVQKFVKTFVELQPHAYKHLISVLSELRKEYKNVVPTKGTGKICLTALEWALIANVEVFQTENNASLEDQQKLIEAESVFLTIIAGCGSQHILNKASKRLSLLWKDSNYAEQYASVLSGLEQSYSTVILWGFLAKHLSERKEKSIIAKYKLTFLEAFTRTVLGSKTKPPLLVLEFSKPILRQVPHEDFKQLLLPSIQKAMLRNPEIILQCVGHIIANVPIDLSPYSLDLGKALATHLHSKEDLCRDEAAAACRNLAEQCSNPQSVEDLLNHFFGVLNGSEGKLTVVVQRLGVISGVGFLSYHTVTGSESVQKLSEIAAEHFVNILKQEVHEGTLIHAVNMLALWCSKFTTQVPNILLDWFQTAFGLKTSTSAVRNAYIQCMEATFHGNVTLQALPLIPLLIKAVEKSLSLSSQHSIVTEGLSAACLLLRLYTVDVQAENKIKPIFHTLLDVEKLPFLSERYLVAANEDALLVLMQFAERLITDHAAALVNKMKPLNKALFVVLTHPSVNLRKQAQVNMRKLLSILGGSKLAASLLAEFPDFVQQTKVQLPDAEKEDKESKGGGVNEGGGHLFLVSQHSLVEFLILLCSGSNLDKAECRMLGVESVIPAHLPAIVSVQSNVWLRMLTHLKEVPVDFVKTNKEKFFASVLYNTNITPAVENAVKTLVKLAPDEYLPKAVDHVVQLLGEPSLCHVTLEEYEIFCTPDGELYDKSVIENLREDSNIVKNIKRESKLYSYKEQLEEIELRKELEQKKRAKGQNKQPELSKKQQEAMKQQLEKEALIRNHVKEINEQFLRAVKLYFAVLNGNGPALAPYITRVIPTLIPLLSTPLCASKACEMYLELRHSIFNGDLLIWGESLGCATLRMIGPSCRLNPEWTAENLTDASTRIVGTLYSRSCRPVGSIYDEKAVKRAVRGRLTAPAFGYFFQLVSCILQRSSSDSNLCSQCLYIIFEHCNMRSAEKEAIDEDKELLLKDPQYFPRKHMFEVLVQFVEDSLGSLQELACNTLLELAKASSGNPGCAVASFEEIEVLLSSLHSPVEALRENALKALIIMKKVLPHPKKDSEHGFLLLQRLWVAKFDLHERAKVLADSIWEELHLKTDPCLASLLLNDVLSKESIIQAAAANALAEVLQEYPNHISPVLKQLINLYREKSKKPPEVKDMFGRVVPNQTPDNWEPRCGIAQAMGKMAPLLSQEMVAKLINFIVDEGFKDGHPIAQKHMLDAGIAVVDAHGNNSIGILLPVFEGFLDRAPDESSNDVARESVVILLGTLARHLDKDDPKVKPIVAKLIETLSTPSQQVQEAVANCLPPLVPAIKEEAPGLVRKLLHLLLESEKYGERKGAAYGLAGLVKGLGILSLKQMDIMTTLTNAIQNKKNFRHREGALFAFEMLCNMLGRLFEPYVVHMLPHLLLCFGDGNQYVREATDDTAKAVMQKLSAHGVKLVMPILLDALEQESWRTKAGSVELLGAMAFCAPKQLSSCLPSIVPKLIEVLSDSHMKVQKAGAQALKIIGSVIRNPEIQAIVPVLLDALQDPSKKTATCLATLLNTKFVHFIDAPSLALIMPVVQRAFQDRSTETRKMAAQIIGNMYSLTDQKDLAPYLPTIIPGLKQSLLDPVPEVRSVSARALGAMVRGMGESSFEDLLPWLMHTLASEASSVDRSGAAQGLSEVMGGLGVEKLHQLMPGIIATAECPDVAPHVKDGYIMMFIYLPMVFNQDFTPYIGQIINPILKALADENEFVRDTALKAGQRIVNMYAETAITLLLPQLEKGLFDDNWRIRYSSVQLLGDLLYKISGVSGKMTTETADEDDNFGTEQSHKAILQALGAERRNQVLAGLYMGRSDVALMVRQAALHVWKVVVTNTPRTLREILQTLFQLLLGCLASNSYDKRQVAARTLGDLVRKLGERVLPEIIPILEKGLDSDRADQRQGVCIGLSEIMASTSKDMVLTFVDSLVPTVRRALYDPLPEVRQAAAKTFDSLHSTVGVRALEDILPQLLNQLNNPKLAEYTLDGLRQVMAIKSKVVLPYLVPQLTAHPVNTRALSFLSAVAGGALTKHLNKILPALLSALSTSLDTPNEQQELEYCQAVVLTVTDEVGVRTIIDHLLEATRSESVTHRRAAVALLYAFCCQTKADISVYVPQLLRGLIHLFTDSDQAVLQLSWEALNSVTKTLGPAEQLQHVADVRQAVRFAVSDLKGQELMPGFCLQKGITPILPIFREAILNGQSELKEQASQGLGEVIKLTSAEALKPSVVHITGPLIRILGDRFTWNVKVAVLETLSLLLAKVGAVLKPFLPQLQTTFLKALNDGHRTVRLRAASALSHLIVIQVRCDPLFQDVHNAAKNAEDSSIRETMLHALRCIITPAGDKMTDPIRRSVTNTIVGTISIPDDTCRTVAAGCLGALCQWLPGEELVAVALDHLLDDDQTQDWMLRHGRSVALMVALKEAPSCLLNSKWTDSIVKTLISYMTSDRLPIALSGIRGTGFFLKYMLQTNGQIPQTLLVTFAKSLNHSTNEVKQVVALTCSILAKSVSHQLPPHVLKALVPLLVNGTKEKNTIVKANSEYALVSLLRLRSGDEGMQTCLNLLDLGARESLQDVITKVLRKVASHAEPKEDELDDTLLT